MMSGLKRDPNSFLDSLFDKLKWTPEQRSEARAKIRANLQEPVRLIGIGQTGVGKTELLRSIFQISETRADVLRELRTGATESTTKVFFSFSISTPAGFRVEFTDGPGLGEDLELDEQYLEMWIQEIPRHDLLYWVMDASSRDVSHIQRNVARVLEATGFHNRFVLVLNKIDNIELEETDRATGSRGWSTRYNMPSKLLLRQIERRTADIKSKFSRYAKISEDQIIACSALKRWHHDSVLDQMLLLLPPEKRIKLSENRDVKSALDLMDPDVQARLLSEERRDRGDGH